MKISNFKSYVDKSFFTSRLTLVAISVALGLTLSGCSTNNYNNTTSIENTYTYENLDISKIDTNTTDINDRANYYDKMVDDVVYNLTEEELDDFRIDVHLHFLNSEGYDNDKIIFFRNDNTYTGDVGVLDGETKITPGVFELISATEEESLGEIELLEPGANVNITIDYSSKTSTVEVADTNSKTK